MGTGGAGGLLLSTDAGSTWAKVPIGIFTLRISAIASDPRRPWNVLAAVDQGRLAADPEPSGRVYAGTEQGVYRSTVDGLSWSPAGLSAFSIASLVLRGAGGSAELVAATASGELWRSTNAGASWVSARRGLESPFVNVLAADPPGAFLLAGGKGVFRAEAPEAAIGDVTGDGRRDVFDLLVLASRIVGNVASGQAPFAATESTGDLDGDGDLDVLDLVALALRVVEG